MRHATLDTEGGGGENRWNEMTSLNCRGLSGGCGGLVYCGGDTGLGIAV